MLAHFTEDLFIFLLQINWLNVYHQTIRDKIFPYFEANDANTGSWLCQQTEPISKHTNPVPPSESEL